MCWRQSPGLFWEEIPQFSLKILSLPSLFSESWSLFSPPGCVSWEGDLATPRSPPPILCTRVKKTGLNWLSGAVLLGRVTVQMGRSTSSSSVVVGYSWIFFHVWCVPSSLKIFHDVKPVRFDKAVFQCEPCQGAAGHAGCLVTGTTVPCCGCLAARRGIFPLPKLVPLTLVLNQSLC